MAKKEFGKIINIDMGESLLLNIEGIEGKLKSHLIGLIPSEFIIIKAPIGYSGINKYLFEGNKLDVRYIKYGHAYHFETNIISLVTKPKSMLILDYPTTVDSASFRSSERHDCFILCIIEIEGQEYKGNIMDISLEGCRCMITELSSKYKRIIKKDSLNATLKFESPSDKNDIELPVLIVNKSAYKSSSKLGIKFDNIEDETKSRLVSITEFLDMH